MNNGKQTNGLEQDIHSVGKTKDSSQSKIPKDDIYIVGVGASAGGLEALNQFFRNAPHDDAAYVVVQHISPDYKSLMKELLSKHTTLKIINASEGSVVHSNQIYVIPSDKNVTIKDGKLHLDNKPEKRSQNMSIDMFFNSLARDKKSRAIAVILSGVGSDGTNGALAIKKAGGLVIAQEPSSSKFDGMPSSVIASGVADMILLPTVMAEEINYFIEHPGSVQFYNENLSEKDEETLSEILDHVQIVTGRNFSAYKKATIIRRLKRRMLQRGLTDFEGYKKYLVSTPSEAETLSKDFLIGVTGFFRDSEAFKELENKVIPEIIDRKNKDDVVKVWVAGCSTGEEAYSLAILLKEYLVKAKKDIEVKIFASDIDKSALEFAGKGVYDEQVVQNIAPEYLSRYFLKTGTKYKILPELRKMVIFAPHDLINDPPFSRIDLVSCRNVLIYLGPELQRKLLSVFHFSLNLGGYLVLGSSENIGELKNSFADVSPKWKIFKSINSITSWSPSYNFRIKPLAHSLSQAATKDYVKVNLNELLNETVLEEFNTAGVYIDQNFEILQAIGDFKKYLQLPEKVLSFNLLKMVPEELSIALGNGVQKVLKTNEKLVVKDINVRENEKRRNITIFLKPFIGIDNINGPFVLVLFKEEESRELSTENQEIFNKDVHFNERLQELENELKLTKDNLQTAVEQLETSNEELQSTNEELLSANEELQSTNEELQSLNEELYTVNSEHTLKINELEQLNDDLDNYFRSTEISQVFVDRNLVLRNFTPASVNQINIQASDIGRPISHFSHNIQGIDLVKEINKVITSPVEIQTEVQVKQGKWYQMKILPYIRQDKKLDGAVITFVDISELRRLNNFISGIIQYSSSGIIALKSELDKKGEITDFKCLLVNPKSLQILEPVNGGLEGKLLLKEFPHLKEIIIGQFSQVVQTGTPSTFEFEYKANNKSKWLKMAAARLDDGIVAVIEDKTEKKQIEEERRKYLKEVENKNDQLQHWAYLAGNDLQEPLRAITSFGGLLLKKYEDIVDPEAKEYMNFMIKGAFQMQEMILDLLDYSSIENGKKVVQEIKADKLVQYAKPPIFERLQQSKAVISFDTEMPEVKGVLIQLSLLFQHLISNAIKFSRAGETPQITIGVEDKTDQWLFHFKDSGIGFDMKFKDRIFEVFHKLNAKEKYPGNGVGLALCQKIVQRHGGDIWVESQPGKGTTFYFTLPKEVEIL
jgi:two-component system, chemotaxis family, CheB/CheR fusion protein